MTKKDNITKYMPIAGGVIVIVLVGLVVYFATQISKKDKEFAEFEEVMNFEKEQLEREFEDLTYEFDGYTTNIKSDSLFVLLEQEKVKVQQLLEELRITKSTNARRITELKNELLTVRKVMVHYVNQIDSLNTENKALKTENVEVKRKYQEVTRTATQLAKEKETLTEVVSRASMLEVTDFSMNTLNQKGRVVKRYNQIASLRFNFSIPKNITTQPGVKTVFLRITRPDGEVMTKDAMNVFPFEDKQIAYSAKKEFEYEGEAISDVIYWSVEEILQTGSYEADFFIDGNRVGHFAFKIEK